MKARILALLARIDALTLRERAMLFAASATVIVFAGQNLVLGPIEREHAALRAQIAKQQTTLSSMDGEIAATVTAYQVDPDAPARQKLEAIRQETAQLGDSLLAMEHGLVPPERMAPLVDTILRANARLKLVSMRTLPVESMTALGAGSAPAAAPAPAAPSVAASLSTRPAAPGAALASFAAQAVAPAAQGDGQGAPAPARTPDMLYRHGVEVTVRGNYLDMVDYMSALEAMPTRLFWGRAQLDVEEYPASRLTLTLYTLSLDRKWMKL